jgi:hypothetical protein
MKTLKTSIVFAGSVLGTPGDRVRVISRSGAMLIVQNVETGKKGIVSPTDLF